MSTIYRGRLDAGLYAPLTQHLAALGSDRQIVDAVGHLLDTLTREGLLASDPPDGVCDVTEAGAHRATMQLPVSKRVFAVPDSELKIWESGAKVAALFLGTAATGGAIGVAEAAGGLVVGMIGGLFSALVACWKKNTVLPEVQGELLLAVKRRKHSTVEGLLMHLPDGVNIDVEQATAALEALKSVRLADGTTVAFVNEEGGRWWAVNV